VRVPLFFVWFQCRGCAFNGKSIPGLACTARGGAVPCVWWKFLFFTICETKKTPDEFEIEERKRRIEEEIERLERKLREEMEKARLKAKLRDRRWMPLHKRDDLGLRKLRRYKKGRVYERRAGFDWDKEVEEK